MDGWSGSGAGPGGCRERRLTRDSIRVRVRELRVRLTGDSRSVHQVECFRIGPHLRAGRLDGCGTEQTPHREEDREGGKQGLGTAPRGKKLAWLLVCFFVGDDSLIKLASSEGSHSQPVV